MHYQTGLSVPNRSKEVVAEDHVVSGDLRLGADGLRENGIEPQGPTPSTAKPFLAEKGSLSLGTCPALDYFVL